MKKFYDENTVNTELNLLEMECGDDTKHLIACLRTRIHFLEKERAEMLEWRHDLCEELNIPTPIANIGITDNLRRRLNGTHTE